MPGPGLRERKKLRTRGSIVESAVELFEKQGYAATTVVEVAEAADVSPSTVFKSFQAKADLVFGLIDAMISSVRRRVDGRLPTDRTAALLAWVGEELPLIETPAPELLPGMMAIIALEPELRVQERIRLAQLEDVLADGFASDLGESAESMRVRVLAVIATRGTRDVWTAWLADRAGASPCRPARALRRQGRMPAPCGRDRHDGDRAVAKVLTAGRVGRAHVGLPFVT